MNFMLSLIVLLSMAAVPVCLVMVIIQAVRKKPKKKWGIAILLSLVVFIGSLVLVPTCEHEWVEATCETAKTCALCEATEGEPLGHSWTDATCTEPSACDVCGMQDGQALGHEWVEASCETAKHCARCSIEEGEALGHDFSKMEVVKKATCTETGYAEGICSVCGESTGQEIPMKDHKMGKAIITLKATCTEDGTKEQACSTCGFTVTEVVPMTGHKESEWKVTTKATYGSKGVRAISCENCGEMLKTEEYELTAEEKEAAFKKMCEKVSYDDLARYPDEYYLTPVKYKGKVVQVMEDGDDYVLRVNVTKGSYGIYRDTVLVEYTKADSDNGRILEDDIITFYGYAAKTVSYKTVMGATVTIPEVLAIYIDQ